MKIDSDVGRFKNIIRNKVKTDLGKYISSDHLLGQQGKKTVSIPIHRINLPRFIYSDKNGGVGQGDGDAGDPINGDPKKGQGKGKAGEETGEHGFDAEFTTDELAQMFGEQLQLPNIENKGKGQINSVADKYNVGSEGLRHFKRTYKEALKRSIASGTYDPANPVVIPIKNDKRYKAATYKEVPDCNTVVIYMMDVSGSMGTEEKHIVKSEVFWIDLWLKLQYKNLESRFIVHDSSAQEVDREHFFSISESGGTQISSAYELCLQIMEEDHPFSDWNVYPFHFSDGDNYGTDNEHCVELLRDRLIPNSNIFSYGQVASGSGDFMKVMEANFPTNEKVSLSEIRTRDDIMASIKTFLGKGK